MIEELEKRLLIDRHNIDEEVVEQGERYYEIASAHAEAVSMRDKAYEAIKQTDAQLYLDLRSELEAEGQKVTETMLGNLVAAHKKHIEAHQDWAEAKADAETLGALKDAFHQRGYMLRDLVQLIVSGHFTDTSMGSAGSNAREYKTDVQREKVARAKRRRMSE